MDELLVKYKELGKIVNFLTDLASQTSVVIDKKAHSQGETVPVELLSNYTAYMGALNLMVVHSSCVWIQRKMLKALAKKEEERSKVWNKLKESLLGFANAAGSLVKPLEYFSKLYNPKAAKTDKVASLADILSLYSVQLEKLQTHYIKQLSADSSFFKTTEVEAVKAGLVSGGLAIDSVGTPIMIGGEDIWIGGMQTQTLMTSHLAKLELLKNESDELVQELAGLYNTDELSLAQTIEKFELNKPVVLLEWDALEKRIGEYLEKHTERYKEFLEESEPHDLVLGGCDRKLFERLETLDRKILIGMCYQEFETIDDIDDPNILKTKWDELLRNIETIKEHPNKRVEIFSDIRNCYDEIESLENQLESIDMTVSKPLAGSGKARLKQIVAIEQEFLPTLQKIESIWLDIAKQMSDLKQHWLVIIDDDDKSSCIKWTGLLVTSLLRLDLIDALIKKRFAGQITLDTSGVSITEDHPRLGLYQEGIGKAKLEELVERVL